MAGRSAQVVAETRSISLPVALAIPQYDTDVVVQRIEPTRVAALFQQRPMTGPSVIFFQQVSQASAAAPVAEGGAKPESSPNWTAVTTPARKLAHYAVVSKESLADFANFDQIVNQEMVRGLVVAENAQILTGSGAGTVVGVLNGTTSPEIWRSSARTSTSSTTKLRCSRALI